MVFKQPPSSADAASKIYILHENDEWVVPLRAALNGLELPFEEWFLDEGLLSLETAPPPGVFYNRMSASSHTRGHRYGPELTAAVLAWLERYGRTTLNGSGALQLELTKVGQQSALERLGVRTPRTIATVGRNQLLEAAQQFDGAFITKHNRAGKGLGVQLFKSTKALGQYVDGDSFDSPIDGITLLQEYIESPQSYITRVEMIGRKFHYAVRVDTSEGFELCPADACAIDDAFCPVGEEATQRAKFEILEGFDRDLLSKYETLMRENDIHIAAFESIVDSEGVIYTYDINTNTNYNSAAETVHGGKQAMVRLAEYLGESLKALADQGALTLR